MTKRRLLEVVSGLGLGGAERALLNRMKYLPSDLEQVILNVRPEIDSLQLNSTFSEHRVGRTGVRRLLDIYRFVSHNTFNVIIVRTPLDAIRFSFLKFLKRSSVPILVFEAHSNFVSKNRVADKLLGILLRVAFTNIDVIIAVSKNVANGPLCKGHKRICVVYLGAELKSPLCSPIMSPIPRFIFVGRLVELKRPIWLLERFLAISSQQRLPRDTLTIVGSGPLEQEVKDFLVAHNLLGVVQYVGEQLDIAPHMLSSTHLLSASTNEGLPLTFFEAKLAGLAIIATPSGGGSEIFGPEDRELRSFKEEEFEEALISVLAMPSPSLEERQKIQSNSYWMRASECSIKYYALLRELLTER